MDGSFAGRGLPPDVAQRIAAPAAQSVSNDGALDLSNVDAQTSPVEREPFSSDGDGIGQGAVADQSSHADPELRDVAIHAAATGALLRHRNPSARQGAGIGQGTVYPQDTYADPEQCSAAIDKTIPIAPTRRRTPSGESRGDVQAAPENHSETDVATPPPNGGSPPPDSPPPPGSPDDPSRESVATIVELWRLKRDLERAYQKLDLQGQATCRRFCNGEKTAAQKLWRSVLKGACDDASVELALMPYRLAMEPLAQHAKGFEKTLVKLAKAQPLWAWAESVRGLGAPSFAGLLGEAGRPITDYRSVSALWKRMGLAVIGGERQRKCANAEKAIEHGYNPQRRSYAYVIATNMIKAQGTGEKAGPYRLIYDAAKASALAKEWTLLHAHNHGMRLMVKALLKDAWVAARALERADV